MKDKKVLVTGAGGFIGHYLVDYLKEQGYWVRGADLKEPEFAPTAADEFLRLVDGHSLGELVDKHGEILKADVALKTSGGHEAALLEALVCRLAAPATAGRAT